MPVATLALWFVVIAIAIGIRHDVPVIDDWTYAWTVEHLLGTGTFSVLDWSSAYPLAQALWGAAWSALLGFSFTTLSFSTMVLGLAGCIALYYLIRELGASRPMALIGAFSLAVNPLFVFLSASFMTDVPFITFTTLALLCYARAATRGDARYVWLASACAFAAFLTRQVGLILPVAGLPLVLAPVTASAAVSAAPRWPLRRSHVVLSLGATWAVMILTWVVLRQQLGVTSVMQRWASNIYAGPAEYHLLVPYFFALISFYLLPVLLADASVRGIWRRPRLLAGILAALTLLLIVVHRDIPLPLRHDQTWSLYELGSSRALINGELPERMPAWLDLPARVAALLAFTLLVAVIAGRGQWRERVTRWIQSPQRSLPRVSIVLFMAAYLVLVNLLWMYNDRYYLVLVPPLVALILGGHVSPPVGRLRLATSALVMFALIALVGTRDAQRFNQAVRDASQALLDSGVPPSEIDAGYAWNGWMLYAHPRNLAPGMAAWRDVPWVTSLRQAEYVISKTPDLKGYRVERTLSWEGLPLPWPARNQLFVLKQEQGADTAASVSEARPDTQ
jgi:4-amino-4-deoxy-L-arabinose transferase-like glycosyltransferase